ncbi:MAG: hypothetical protein ABI573_01595 [Chloroflexota bacterium]
MSDAPWRTRPWRLLAIATVVSVLAGCGTSGTIATAPVASPTEATMPSSPLPSAGTSTFVGEGFTFAYPANWAVLSEYAHVGVHGPTVMGAVGIGEFDAGCTVDATSATCPADPNWVVPADGVVLVYRFGAWLGPIVSLPPETPGPGERSVDVGGRPAFRSDGAMSMRIRFAGAPEYIEARWGADSADAPMLIQAVLGSWVWTSPPIR